ncbi:hypothetical protein [Streptomyces sp. NBC_00503]|nr:hypothetical protein [Streptomyces sp. NBC_00503]WUD79519.1 hypothetical protein OG490_02415 [Streptomyces sp. NBC_00503]
MIWPNSPVKTVYGRHRLYLLRRVPSAADAVGDVDWGGPGRLPTYFG